MVKISKKKKTLHLNRVFCTFPCPRCTTTTWNFLVSPFLPGREHKTTILYFIVIIYFFNLDTVLYNANPEKLTNIWWPIERRAIRTIDFDTAWIHSLRDVFATSSSSLLKLPLMTKMVTIVMMMKMSTVGWWLPWRWWWKKKWTRKENTKNLQVLHDISSLSSL